MESVTVDNVGTQYLPLCFLPEKDAWLLTFRVRHWPAILLQGSCSGWWIDVTDNGHVFMSSHREEPPFLEAMCGSTIKIRVSW